MTDLQLENRATEASRLSQQVPSQYLQMFPSLGQHTSMPGGFGSISNTLQVTTTATTATQTMPSIVTTTAWDGGISPQRTVVDVGGFQAFGRSPHDADWLLKPLGSAVNNAPTLGEQFLKLPAYDPWQDTRRRNFLLPTSMLSNNPTAMPGMPFAEEKSLIANTSVPTSISPDANSAASSLPNLDDPAQVTVAAAAAAAASVFAEDLFDFSASPLMASKPLPPAFGGPESLQLGNSRGNESEMPVSAPSLLSAESALSHSLPEVITGLSTSNSAYPLHSKSLEDASSTSCQPSFTGDTVRSEFVLHPKRALYQPEYGEHSSMESNEIGCGTTGSSDFDGSAEVDDVDIGADADPDGKCSDIDADAVDMETSIEAEGVVLSDERSPETDSNVVCPWRRSASVDEEPIQQHTASGRISNEDIELYPSEACVDYEIGPDSSYPCRDEEVIDEDEDEDIDADDCSHLDLDGLPVTDHDEAKQDIVTVCEQCDGPGRHPYAERGGTTHAHHQMHPTRALRTFLPSLQDHRVQRARALRLLAEEFRVGDIQLKELIGKGAYGEVARGELWGEDVAVKRVGIAGFKDTDVEAFLHEVSIISTLRHPNIITFLGASIEADAMCIVTEYCHGGSLESVVDRLRAQGKRLSLRKTVDFAIQICRGLNWLHHKHIIHRDLKTANILIGRHGDLKIADFGLAHAKAHATSRGFYGAFGTACYAAPEVLRNAAYDFKADVFSFGIVVLEMVLGTYPYASVKLPATEASFQEAIIRGLRPAIPSWCHPQLKMIIEACIEDDPLRRPTIAEVANELTKLRDLLRQTETIVPQTATPPHSQTTQMTRSDDSSTILLSRLLEQERRRVAELEQQLHEATDELSLTRQVLMEATIARDLAQVELVHLKLAASDMRAQLEQQHKQLLTTQAALERSQPTSTTTSQGFQSPNRTDVVSNPMTDALQCKPCVAMQSLTYQGSQVHPIEYGETYGHSCTEQPPHIMPSTQDLLLQNQAILQEQVLNNSEVHVLPPHQGSLTAASAEDDTQHSALFSKPTMEPLLALRPAESAISSVCGATIAQSIAGSIPQGPGPASGSAVYGDVAGLTDEGGSLATKLLLRRRQTAFPVLTYPQQHSQPPTQQFLPYPHPSVANTHSPPLMSYQRGYYQPWQTPIGTAIGQPTTPILYDAPGITKDLSETETKALTMSMRNPIASDVDPYIGLNRKDFSEDSSSLGPASSENQIVLDQIHLTSDSSQSPSACTVNQPSPVAGAPTQPFAR